MLILYEVFVTPGSDPDSLLSADVLRETQAQIMTPDQARALGFSGMQPDPHGRQIRLVAVTPSDAQFVQRRLEASPAVDSFRAHEVDM